MADKIRLDTLVFERGYTQSREKAKAVIMAGQVYVNNQKADKPGTLYPVDAQIEVRGVKLKYVSRGGLKLEKAIEVFKIDLKDCIAMDIGASTRGFTDCMLQNGARKVYAVDVGYGQLDWKLRNDKRVVNLERTNIRKVTKEEIPEQVDFFSVDVSFISLRLVLPVASAFMKETASAVCLIKPQFEAGREKVGKKGVVRDPLVHTEVIENICTFCLANGFDVLGLDFSPVKGPEGNIEYLVYIKPATHGKMLAGITPQELAIKSHAVLDKKEK